MSEKKSKRKKSKKERREKKHRGSRKSSSSSSSSSWSEEEDVVAKKVKTEPELEVKQASSNPLEEEEEEEAYGPMAPFSFKSSSTSLPSANYGGQLLQGEGSALAEFARRNERIPRRGEVGYDGEKIKQFEELGYVMSGSRHKRMEAVRKRKENQIFSAEEKRLLLINESKSRAEKEAKVLEDIRHLIRKKDHEEASKNS